MAATRLVRGRLFYGSGCIYSVGSAVSGTCYSWVIYNGRIEKFLVRFVSNPG